MFRLLFLAFLFPLLANAQDKPGKRTCRILFLNPPPNAPEKLFLYDGTKSQEVQIPKMNFSDVYEVAGGDTTICLLPKAILKPEELPAGAPSGKVAAGIVDFYLVVNADPKNPVTPVKLQIIDAGSGKFGKGQMMWYNLTPFSIGGQLGSQKLAMKAQSRAIVDPPVSGAEAYDVVISYVLPGESQFRPISQTKWVHDPRSRMILFVYGGSNNVAPQISGFTDFRDAPKPE